MDPVADYWNEQECSSEVSKDQFLIKNFILASFTLSVVKNLETRSPRLPQIGESTNFFLPQKCLGFLIIFEIIGVSDYIFIFRITQIFLSCQKSVAS